MLDAVMAELHGVDVFIAAAAVADYRPKQVSAQKIKKSDSHFMLELERTTDILATVSASSGRPQTVVGFAAETERLEEYALGKLAAKNLDFIAANDVGDASIGFESENNALTVFARDGSRHGIDQGSKQQVAADFLALINKQSRE